ncbi:IS3 family transposase [Streptomyces sp. H10-C2]|uniref:IS3 family transposase n=1 Tax=unclassified Streptomyces TaxID=2593676 RepID=UPI0024BA0821|nr:MULTISPECIES: IS3 family transposase [unclassified Streptomyces]MDJ0345372.1 IS3 family transposase [Streptomyces sp. PH10-H1]MDJ0372127.1 IS3 family transposase [Streptomyces sp. H10-C2]
MARPSKFSPEFRSDAIALWRASAGRRTYRDVATDLNVNPETLRVWVRDVDGPPADGGKVTPGDAEAELAPVAGGDRPAAEGRERVAAGARDPATGSRLFRERDEVRTLPQALRAGETPCWDFVSAHAGVFGVQRLCRVLQVSRSGYYRWLAGIEARDARRAEDQAPVAEIREIHTEHRENYGALRVHAELRGFGHTVNRKRVARLMRENGIVGRHLHRKKRTTVPDRLAPPAPDLVQREFTARRLDEKWCGDITYVQVGAWWLYVASVIDICSRRVIGWSMAPHMRAELVIDALRAAVAARAGDVTGVIFHSDRGSQYTSAAFAQVSDQYGIRRSMGKVGSSYHNALAESLWQGLKQEVMHKKLFLTMGQARLEIFRWLTYYNARRRHSTLSYLSPLEFEQQHHQQAKLSLLA